MPTSRYWRWVRKNWKKSSRMPAPSSTLPYDLIHWSSSHFQFSTHMKAKQDICWMKKGWKIKAIGKLREIGQFILWENNSRSEAEVLRLCSLPRTHYLETAPKKAFLTIAHFFLIDSCCWSFDERSAVAVLETVWDIGLELPYYLLITLSSNCTSLGHLCAKHRQLLSFLYSNLWANLTYPIVFLLNWIHSLQFIADLLWVSSPEYLIEAFLIRLLYQYAENACPCNVSYWISPRRCDVPAACWDSNRKRWDCFSSGER